MGSNASVNTNGHAGADARAEKARALSEQPFPIARTPRALLVALVVLIGVELGVRAADPSDVIPYENTGREAYGAVRNFLDAEGPAAVAFLGSSRGRAAILVPEVRKIVKEALGRHVRVSNYASPGAAADEVTQIARLILRQEKRKSPQVILYGVSPLQLAQAALSTDHAGELWYFEDWLREVRFNLANERRWREALSTTTVRDTRSRLRGQLRNLYELGALPDVVRNEIGLRYKTFAYRESAAKFFAVLLDLERPWPTNPIDGQYSMRQSRKRQRNLAEKPVPERRVRNYLEKRMEGDAYPLGGRQLEHLVDLITLCRAHDVPLILYEMPRASILDELMPEGTVPTFLDMINTVCRTHEVPFITHDELGIVFEDRHFREQSHVNTDGARLISEALARQVIAPLLNDERTYASFFEGSEAPAKHEVASQ